VTPPRPRLLAAVLAGLVLIGLGLTGQAALADGNSPVTQPQADGTSAAPSPTADPSSSASPGNQAPVAGADQATVQAGKSVPVNALANDNDPDHGPQALSITGTDDPRLTIITDDGGGQSLTFKAAAGDSGNQVVHYTLTDGASPVQGTVTVSVTALARAVTLSVPKTIVALRHYTVSGRTSPTALGRPTVTLQRRSGDTWVTVAATTSSSAGAWKVPFSTNRIATYVFRARAVWPDKKAVASGTSKRVVQVLADAVVSGPLTRSQVPWSYRSGCPVGPSGLRKVTINRVDYDHHVARGTLVLRASATGAMVAVFKAAIHDRFPIKSMHPTDYYYDQGRRTPTQSDEAAMRAGNTAAFNCRPVTGNPYRVSQHSYGNAIDINTIQNPYVTGSRVYPDTGRPYLDRSPYRTGMILRGGVIASKMASLGWPWGARWSHPDYQHFSSNGG